MLSSTSRSLLTATVVALTLANPALGAIGPIADLHIVNANVAPDGVPRSAVTVGGNAVGPLIVGNKGDNFKLNVINDLTDTSMDTETSIHWHGLFQKGTNWADGPVFVTQCPIIAGDSFLYDFDVPDQAGTFWYHSHLANQYCDGLRGAMVIYDPNDPHKSLYDVDDESTVITLSDWYHLTSKSYYIGVSDAQLLNGKGRGLLSGALPLSVITVQKGKRYRFRLVNIACDPDFKFSIQGHTMNVIEVDGVSHQPRTVDQIDIFAGQRYSFVLTANQAVNNYWIRFNPSLGIQGYAGGTNSAILRYQGAAAVEPSPLTIAAPSNPLREQDLIPLENPGAPGVPGKGNADVNLELDVTFLLTFFINGVSYLEPTVPVLLQVLSGARSPNDLLPEGSIFYLPPNKVVEITIPGGSLGGGHPIHLHGHTFDVVRSAGMSNYNYVNPPRRDVVDIGALGDFTTIRFETDNSGPWLLHCHIDWHFNIGFGAIMAEIPEQWTTDIHPSAAWDQLCPAYMESISKRDPLSLHQ